MKQTKQQRVDIINKIVEKIATTGRNFYSYKGVADKFFLKNNRVYLADAYSGKDLCLETKFGYPPKGFHMGGTMWGLAKDFKKFIHEGVYSNHTNGYGGLYCPHWGYPEEAMKEIQELATELGYLIKDVKP